MAKQVGFYYIISTYEAYKEGSDQGCFMYCFHWGYDFDAQSSPQIKIETQGQVEITRQNDVVSQDEQLKIVYDSNNDEIQIRRISDETIMFYIDDSYGFMYKADKITKCGVVLVSDVYYFLNNRQRFVGVNLDDYLNNQITYESRNEEKLGISQRLWNIKEKCENNDYVKGWLLVSPEDNKTIIGDYVFIQSANTSNVYNKLYYDGVYSATGFRNQTNNNYNPFVVPCDVNYREDLVTYATPGYWFSRIDCENYEAKQLISYTGFSQPEDLIGNFVNVNEYDWPEEPPVPPVPPTDDDITAICITNRELHLKKVKQPNKLGNLYIITTRAKKKK